jgi:hypothetical protein
MKLTPINVTLLSYAFCLLSLIATLQSEAYIYHQNNFEAYTYTGVQIPAPWVTGGSSQLKEIVAFATSAPHSTDGTQVARIFDNSSNANGKLRYDFPTSETGNLDISFDFKSNSYNRYLTFAIHGASGKSAYINLSQHSATPEARNMTSSTTYNSIASLEINTWYHVDINTSAINSNGIETFSITIKEGNATIATQSNLSMRFDAGSGYTAIEFFNNSRRIQRSSA